MSYINPCESSAEGPWQKANFHTHAGTGPGTCGAKEIDDVVLAYQAAGYTALAVSNHDLYTEVASYAKRHNMLLIGGYELTMNTHQRQHMLCIGTDELLLDEHQPVIDACARRGGFCILCHPNWKFREYWPREKMSALQGYAGIEILNSLVMRKPGNPLATDAWDYLLSQGKLVWGFGNDDFHAWCDLGKSWNMILSEPTEYSLIQAVKRGSFYVSSGLYLQECTLHEKTFRIRAQAHDTYVNEYLYRFVGSSGRVLHETVGDCGTYELTGSEPYVRAEVCSGYGAMLWTQPVYDPARMR